MYGGGTRAHAGVLGMLGVFVIGALDELVAVVRDVVLRAAAYEGGQVETRLADGAGEAGGVGAADKVPLGLDGAALGEDEGERARVVVARDGRVDAARRAGVQAGEQAARVGAPLGAARLVEAEVAQVAAAGAAPPDAARRLGVLVGQQQRAGAARVRRGGVHVRLRQLVVEAVAARARRGVGRPRGSVRVRVRVCAGGCVRAWRRRAALTWWRALPTRRRSGSARADTFAARLTP